MPLPLNTRWTLSDRCAPFRDVYLKAESTRASSWEQVEVDFVQAMQMFDRDLASSVGMAMTDEEKSELAADLQNGKGDFFNDLLALLLLNCSGVDHLSTRRGVPGLIVKKHNLDGVYPDDGPVTFMLEAKMMGTPKHINSPKQKVTGRRGSADIEKRVKELAFKCIDLKGERGRQLAQQGEGGTGGAGGGDLTTWLRGIDPKIYFFIGVRVVNDADFRAAIRWAYTASMVLDAVGLCCFQPVGNDGSYRIREDVPTELQLDRVLYRACNDLRATA